MLVFECSLLITAKNTRGAEWARGKFLLKLYFSSMKALDDETQENEGLELTLEQQMMDLMLEEEKDKEPSINKSSQIFSPKSMSTKVRQWFIEDVMYKSPDFLFRYTHVYLQMVVTIYTTAVGLLN